MAKRRNRKVNTKKNDNERGQLDQLFVGIL